MLVQRMVEYNICFILAKKRIVKINIALGDVRHGTAGVHSGFVPVGIGYIATHLKAQLPECSLDIRLYTDPEAIIQDLESWRPNIVALSHYMWNASLSYRICEIAKQIDASTLCVLGGPEFPSGTGQSNLSNSKELCRQYLVNRPAVDFFCYSDGETAMLSILKAYVQKNHDTDGLIQANVPIDGTVALSTIDQSLLVGRPQTRIGLGDRVIGRDVIPSPYLDGLLDQFLDGSFIPAIETQRGCPFLCTFCDQGLDSTKMVSFTVERIRLELIYIANKLAGLSEARTLAIHDSNWGMYKQDVELARSLRKIIDVYDWPKHISISAPKNKKERILDIDVMLLGRVAVGLSQQSMDRTTLKEIKRDNYTNEQYLEFVKELQSRGKAPGCALIIPLPGETEESYQQSVKILIDNGLTTGTWTLMMLPGAELGREKARREYGMTSRFRMIPRQFGEYGRKKVFEIEEVCVATNTMTFDAYLRCRRFSFLMYVLGMNIFDPIRKYLAELNISYYDVIRGVHAAVESGSLSSNFGRIYKEFSEEAESELFKSREQLVCSLSVQSNYQKLLDGEIGDNLLRKYSTIVLMDHLDELTDYVYELTRIRWVSQLEDSTQSAGEAVVKWTKHRISIGDYGEVNNSADSAAYVDVSLPFDVPLWERSGDKTLKQFCYPVHYRVHSKMHQLQVEATAVYRDDKYYQMGRLLHTRELTDLYNEFVRVS